MATNEIMKSEPLQEYLQKPEVTQRLIGLFPNSEAAKRYVQSVLLLVQSSEPGEYSLANCSNESVLYSALRAISLRVSVDPALRQAWLVPRKNRKTQKIEAGLQLHYNEIFNRAMRTNRYRCINVSAVYEGSTVLVDIYTGLHLIQLKDGLMTSPEQSSRFVPVSERKGKVIGWLGYSKEIRTGAEKTVYMTIEDIVAFVTLHNPYWTSSKAWRENRAIMEQKTVLLALLRKSDLGDPQMSELKEVLDETEGQDEENTVDAEVSEMEDEPGQNDSEEITEEEARYLDACAAVGSDGVRYGDRTDEKLGWVIAKSKQPEKVTIAKTILDWRKAHNITVK